MANQGMIYQGEREEGDFLMAGVEHVYVFTEVYSIPPQVHIDEYDGNGDGLSYVTTLTECTITGDDGASGHITVVG